MVLVVLSDADLWRLAGSHSMKAEPAVTKALVQIKFGSREAEPSRFSSRERIQVKGERSRERIMTGQGSLWLYGQHGYYIIISRKNDWNTTIKEDYLH